ncbi:hypothetical protein BLAT2472_120152 [Burkholderia latens]|uniref:hypothetical protein n=1 Tax=Burkholderia latens TaxID=488446 RepID=UPI0039A46BB2
MNVTNRAAVRRSLPDKAFSEVTERAVNGLDNSLQYPDAFDASHIKSSKNDMNLPQRGNGIT